jgi:hypothetical protein
MTDWPAWKLLMEEALDRYHGTGALSPTEVTVLRRAPYFGGYRWALHFSPTVDTWSRFEEISRWAGEAVTGTEHRLVISGSSLSISLYASEAEALNRLHHLCDLFDFHSLRMIDPACWGWPLPKPKPKGLYYGRYRFRVRLAALTPAPDPDERAGLEASLEAVSGADWRLDATGSLLYCATTRDVILAKLIFADQICEITERKETP